MNIIPFKLISEHSPFHLLLFVTLPACVFSLGHLIDDSNGFSFLCAYHPQNLYLQARAPPWNSDPGGQLPDILQAPQIQHSLKSLSITLLFFFLKPSSLFEIIFFLNNRNLWWWNSHCLISSLKDLLLHYLLSTSVRWNGATVYSSSSNREIMHRIALKIVLIPNSREAWS